MAQSSSVTHAPTSVRWAEPGVGGPRGPLGQAQQPRVCPQTWTSARPAAAAVSTTAPTWPAPSSAPVRLASGWTRTVEAVPVSPCLSPQGPCLLGTCPLCPPGPPPPPSWPGRAHLSPASGCGTSWGQRCRGRGWSDRPPPGQGFAQGSRVVRFLSCPAPVREGPRTASKGGDCPCRAPPPAPAAPVAPGQEYSWDVPLPSS